MAPPVPAVSTSISLPRWSPRVRRKIPSPAFSAPAINDPVTTEETTESFPWSADRLNSRAARSLLPEKCSGAVIDTVSEAARSMSTNVVSPSTMTSLTVELIESSHGRFPGRSSSGLESCNSTVRFWLVRSETSSIKVTDCTSVPSGILDPWIRIPTCTVPFGIGVFPPFQYQPPPIPFVLTW